MITRSDPFAVNLIGYGARTFAGEGAPPSDAPAERRPTSSLAEVLAASAAAPDHADALGLYGQFVGDWEFDVTNYRPDGSRETGRGEWRFGWILEGRAIQDVWRVPFRIESQRNRAPLKGLGTTLRLYDSGRGVWTVVWVGAVTGTVIEFTVCQEGSELIQAGHDPATGRPLRWIFSSIQADSFRWRAVTSKDHGTTWDLLQEMDVRRRIAHPNGIDVVP